MSIEFVPTVNYLREDLPSPSEVLVLFCGEKLLLAKGKDGMRRLPTGQDWTLPESLRRRLVLGKLGSQLCSLIEIPANVQLPEILESLELRQARRLLASTEDFAVCRAKELAFWRNRCQFCTSCGNRLVDHETECARICPVCQEIFYPVITPAVIVAVTDDRGRLLLAHNAKFRPSVYALIAGFVESGENLENAVRREIREEVGIEVKNIRFFDSQSWPYPNALMVGFTAEYAGGAVVPDGVEITDAGFYTPENLPEIPSPGSISRRLIDHWLSQYKGKKNE